ncbi:Nucleoid-associated protein YgaU, contains BON and LysM domains [Sulfitobacter marinus]|uniref:Nucleoid-associated protein YgaU, contains BON and LysM domains n=1 Tax=Sulfitobacter marinus TaxID=394264 RepID=A0A1I6PU06_9RHOB|nr:Ig-like domain-containing protein [Sulfitobacter marinus]SFS43701.1 Nucleoid-associated protein YgaU, contains BON and LysM domains [Sulfitobacter marinus]
MSVFQSRNAQVLGGIVVAAVVVVAGYFLFNQDFKGGETVQIAPADDQVAAAPEPAKPQPPAAAEPPVQIPDPAPQKPSFDEVRRDADGMTVIAGRAAPGSEVKVVSNGTEIAKTTADSAGKFATLAILPPDGKGQVLSLEAQVEDTETRSEDEVILAPMTPKAPAAVAAKENSKDVSEAVEEKPKTEAIDSEVAQSEPAEPASQVPAQQEPTQQVALLKSTRDGVELLTDDDRDAAQSVALDTITYSEQGEVQLAGRAQSQGAAVQVYLDNDAVGKLPVDEEGRWSGDIEGIDTGIYTLRVDELDQDGGVISRVETPFKRESAETLARATANYDGPIKEVTVQEGATLWAIARERYGDPTLYLRVVEANRSAIRDPDLIYPGQVFDLPD